MWNFKDYSENIALLSDQNQSITYGHLIEENERLASKINDRCLVFSLCTNTIGSIIGYTTFLQGRIVPALLSAHLDLPLLDRLLATYHPSYLWMPANMVENAMFQNMCEVYRAWEYVLLQTNYDNNYKLYDELALLLTTSGSTGSPKFVRQSYNNISCNTKQIVEYLQLHSDERPVTTLPMNYTYGCSIINTHLMVGATILLTDETIMSRTFWSFMKAQRATSIAGVPYTYEILDKLRISRMELPDLRYFTQAGGKLSVELHRKYAEYAENSHKKFIVMYGACEATARMSYLPAEYSLTKCGSCGIPIPNGNFYLLDDAGAEIREIDEPGELIYEGENVTLGYAECGEDLVKGDERHGRLYTGDIAKRDQDGFYYIVGRKKRFLKIYGNRVNLDEIDLLIKEAYGIECASAGVDDHLFIFLVNGTDMEEVRKYVSEKTKLNPSAFKVICLEKIPKNESGKVLYKELEKYYQ